jgi:hypothetical protein
VRERYIPPHLVFPYIYIKQVLPKENILKREKEEKYGIKSTMID